MPGTEITAKFLPRSYDIFAGLDVDKKHIDVTFTDHGHLMQSMKISYDADHLLAYSRRHSLDSGSLSPTKPVVPVLVSTIS